MYETIEDILFHSNSSRRERLDEGWSRSYNLRMPIGPYTLSIGLGEGMYSAPRVALDDATEYTAVECAILNDDGLLGVREITHKFGTDVAKLCEGYGFDEDDGSIGEMLANGSTVMPYITWDDVIMVANTIDKHSPSAKDLV